MLQNKAQSIAAIIKVAKALRNLNEKVVYAGGSVAALYADDPAAPEVRPTKDVDIILEITSEMELEKIRHQLAKHGINVAKDEKIICRFTYKKILIDVMSTQEIGWAPSNPWFKSGYDSSEIRQLENVRIRILPIAYYLASKFAAFHSRGNDPRTSADFEDIVYILDNNRTLVKDIRESDVKVKTFLISEFQNILKDDLLKEALLAHLEPGIRTERYKMIIMKLEELCS